MLHYTYVENMSETVKAQLMNYCSSHLDKHQLDFDNTLSTFIFILASVNEEVAFSAHQLGYFWCVSLA